MDFVNRINGDLMIMVYNLRRLMTVNNGSLNSILRHLYLVPL